MGDIPDDIVRAVSAQFPQRSAGRVLKELVHYDGREQDRVWRCIVYLSAGDPDRIEQNVQRARADYRDVIYWAEYDRDDNRVNDFTKPFPT